MGRTTFFCLRGFMKSGTNWMGALLNSHPRVRCLGEFHWQEIMGPAYARLRNPTLYGDEAFKRITLRELERAIRRCLRLAAGNQALFIGERTPTTLAPVILRRAPHVVMVRDGRDVLVSRAFHLFNNPGVTKLFDRHPELQQDLREFQADPWFFRRHPERLLQNQELVIQSARWWRQHLHRDRRTMAISPRLKVKVVRYEELHADCAGVLRSVFEFLGVDPDGAPPPHGELLPGFSEERPHEFFRKGAVGDWQIYFQPRTRELFQRVAGEELIRQGYCASADW